MHQLRAPKTSLPREFWPYPLRSLTLVYSGLVGKVLNEIVKIPLKLESKPMRFRFGSHRCWAVGNILKNHSEAAPYPIECDSWVWWTNTISTNSQFLKVYGCVQNLLQCITGQDSGEMQWCSRRGSEVTQVCNELGLSNVRLHAGQWKPAARHT